MSSKPTPRAVILCIEDNPDNQLLIQVTLEAGGFQVQLASSADEALASIDRLRPDLILMDIQLPGMDGLSLTRKMKADPALKDIAIVALSARAMRGDRELSIAAGCAGHISKPIDTRTIAYEVAQFIGRGK